MMAPTSWPIHNNISLCFSACFTECTKSLLNEIVKHKLVVISSHILLKQKCEVHLHMNGNKAETNDNSQKKRLTLETKPDASWNRREIATRT